jgi:hypothetical protein
MVVSSLMRIDRIGSEMLQGECSPGILVSVQRDYLYGFGEYEGEKHRDTEGHREEENIGEGFVDKRL